MADLTSIPVRTKDPDAVLDYPVNWGGFLNASGNTPPDDFISESIWAVAPFTLLAEDVDDMTNTLQLSADTEGFPALGLFDIMVEMEQMNVQAISNEGQTFTVTRGVNGTAAAAHSAGAIVQKVSALKIGTQTLTTSPYPLIARAFVSGGVPGREYCITNRVTTNGGRVNDQSIRIKIKNR
jgi:hypothetical protein